MPLFKGKMPKKSMDDDAKEKSLAVALGVKNSGKASKKAPRPMDLPELEDKPSSLASAIMGKRKKMADGGMVDIEENNEEQPNKYDDLNEEALDRSPDSTFAADMKEDYSEPSPLDEQDIDDHSMIAKLMARMRARRGA